MLDFFFTDPEDVGADMPDQHGTVCITGLCPLHHRNQKWMFRVTKTKWTELMQILK